jgi:hypothetical protein
MAAGLGYKEFATGDVLTAADANGYLASQVVMVFASAAARTSAIASPQEGMISYLKDTNSTEYYSGSAWAAVGAGGGGKVLQVVFASTNTNVTVASTTPTDSGLTASITPSASTSKILVIYNQALFGERNTTAVAGAIRLLRGATVIQDLGYPKSINLAGVTNVGFANMYGASYLDSPATTSSTTYKTQVNVNTTANSGYVAANSGVFSTITLLEIGA